MLSYFQPGRYTEFRVIESLLRISTKFLVQSLRAELIEHLKAYYPSTLAEFRDAHTKNYSFFKHTAPYHSLLAANMAREFDIPIILPAALYYCCEPPYEKITEGVEDEGGNMVKLGHSDQLLCVTAQRFIASVQLTVLNSFILGQVVSPECSDRVSCRREMVELLVLAASSLTSTDIFTSLHLCDRYKHHLCENCHLQWEHEATTGYYKLWMGLPARFGLPSWNELATLTDKTVSWLYVPTLLVSDQLRQNNV